MANTALDIVIRSIVQGNAIPQTQAEFDALEKKVGAVKNALGALGVAFGLREGFDLAKDLADAARAAEDARGALTAAAGDAATYEEAIAAAKEATRGMASEAQLASALTPIFGSNLASNATEAANLAAAGTTLVGVFKDSGASMDLFTRYLATGSRELSNNFSVSEQLITSIQKQIEATGQAAGNEARVLAVRQAVVETARQYQGALSDDTTQAMRYEAALSDVKVALGGLILPQFTEGMRNLGDAARFAADSFQDMKSALDDAHPSIQGAVQALGEAVSPISQVNALFREGRELASDFSGATEDAASTTDSLSGAQIDAAEAAQAEAAALGPVVSSLDAMGFSAAGAGAGVESLTRGLYEQRQAALEAAEASREYAAAKREEMILAGGPATNREADAYRQMAQARAGMADTVSQYQVEQSRQEEQAAREQEQRTQQSARAMVRAFDEVGNQIASSVSSAVSGAVSAGQEWVSRALGVDNDGQARAEENLRRMAAIAQGGFSALNEQGQSWANVLSEQFANVQPMQAFVNAVRGGDNAALMAEARRLALNPIVEMFDANAIAAQVEAKLRAQQLQQALDAKVNALLGERGLSGVENVSRQITGVVTDTGAAAQQVGADLTGLTTGAEQSGEKIAASYDAGITKLRLIRQLIDQIIGRTEEWGQATQAAVDRFNSVGPGAAYQPAGLDAARSLGPVPGL